MKKLTFLLMFLVLLNISSAGELIKDGQAYGRIYTPMTLSRPVLMAVEELRMHIKAMTGVELPLAYRAPMWNDIGIILSLNQKEWKGKESAQAFVIVEQDGKYPRVEITGNTGIAVLYGVYQYLEDLGIRWYEPGEIGTSIPKNPIIKVKNRRFASKPGFISRCIDFSGYHQSIFDYSDPVRYKETIHHEYDLWLVRNRMMFERPIHRGDYFDFNHTAFSMGHLLVKMCKLEPKDFNQNPERFPLVTRGQEKKRLVGRGQICFTNETNFRNAVESAVEKLRTIDNTERNSDLDEAGGAVSLALADDDGICECDACTLAAGKGINAKDRLVWLFMNNVARELNRRVPGGKITLFAPYFELTKPPPDLKIEHNIIAIACRGLGWQKGLDGENSYPLTQEHWENTLATQRAGAEMAVYDYIMRGPVPQPLSILDAAEFYARNGFRRYHVEVMSRHELLWPLLWTLSKFTWNTKLKPRELLEEYCSGYYGVENGRMVLDMIRRIEANGRKLPRIIYGVPADIAVMLPDELIAEFRSAFAVAENRSFGVEKLRIKRLYRSMEAQMRFTEVYRAYVRALNERTGESANEFRKHVREFNVFWEKNSIGELCSSYRFYNTVQELARNPLPELISKARKLKQSELLVELFAGSEVPREVRNLFMLPEKWKIKIDIVGDGLARGWEKNGFDDGKWPEISTYDHFEKQGYTEIDGHFWYRIRFKAPDFPAGERIILRIGSLDDSGDIYLNGLKVFSQTDVWQWDKSFAFDVSETLKPGEENVIAIHGYDGMGAGGLWRPCALYTENNTLQKEQKK